MFDRRGRRATFGGSGEGPGEFLQIWWALPYRGDSIAVYDVRHTVSIFDREGALGRFLRLPDFSRPPSRLPGGTSEWAHAVYPDGAFLASPSGTSESDDPGEIWFRAALLRVGADGARWDTLGDFPVLQATWDGERLGPLPFEPMGHRALRGEELVFGTGERWEIAVHDGAGNLRQLVRRAGELEPVTEEDLEAWRAWYVAQHASGPEGGSQAAERARERARRIKPRPFKPAYSHLLVDTDGNIWAESYRWVYDAIPPNPGPTTWSVFAPDGTWLTDVRVPPRVLVRSVGTDHVIGFLVDELDAKHVQVFELQKPEG